MGKVAAPEEHIELSKEPDKIWRDFVKDNMI